VKARSLVFVTMLAAACGGGQTRGHPFESAVHDEDGRELAKFVARWRAERRLAPLPVAAGTTGDGALVGVKLGGRRWRYAHAVEGQPVVAGDLVIAMGNGSLFALDGESGKKLWELPAYGRLRGAADDGATTIASIATLSGRGSVVLAVARNGTVIRQIHERAHLGVPAVLDDFAFIPYARRSVIVFDLIRGSEVARVVSSTPLTRASFVDDALYFADGEAVRFDRDIVAARRGGGTRIRLPERVLPGAPRWFASDDEADPPRAWLFARPEPGTTPAVEHAAFVSDRFAVGIDAAGTTRWVHRGAHAFVGGVASPGGYVLCDDHGDIVVVDGASGRATTLAALAESIARCDVAAIPAARLPPSPPLLQQLHAALRDPLPSALEVQLMLIDDLAKIPEDGAVDALIDVARARGAHEKPSDSSAQQILSAHAAAKLAVARGGKHRLVARLREARRDSKEGVAPHRGLPIGAMASALSSEPQLAIEAAPALAAFVNDPTLAPSEQEAALAVAAKHGGADSRLALESFVRRQPCAGPHRAADHLIALASRALERVGATELAVRLRARCP
jgi:outer membrane protein assembly factor BamB